MKTISRTVAQYRTTEACYCTLSYMLSLHAFAGCGNPNPGNLEAME